MAELNAAGLSSVSLGKSLHTPEGAHVRIFQREVQGRYRELTVGIVGKFDDRLYVTTRCVHGRLQTPQRPGIFADTQWQDGRDNVTRRLNHAKDPKYNAIALVCAKDCEKVDDEGCSGRGGTDGHEGDLNRNIFQHRFSIRVGQMREVDTESMSDGETQKCRGDDDENLRG